MKRFFKKKAIILWRGVESKIIFYNTKEVFYVFVNEFYNETNIGHLHLLFFVITAHEVFFK